MMHDLPDDIPPGARPHHWGFTHGWLRDAFDRIPETLVCALARARSADPVIESWERMAMTLEPQDRLPAEGFDIDLFHTELDGAPVYLAVVHPPPVDGPGETHMVGLCVDPADGELRPEPDDAEVPREATQSRYFLLDAADDSDAAAALWEWTADGRREHGSLPADDTERFASAILDLLVSEPSDDSTS